MMLLSDTAGEHRRNEQTASAAFLVQHRVPQGWTLIGLGGGRTSSIDPDSLANHGMPGLYPCLVVDLAASSVRRSSQAVAAAHVIGESGANHCLFT
jgi:hypothetical protein